jgi:hypothetical protein
LFEELPPSLRSSHRAAALLTFKEACALSPHARRNPFILTHYAVHKSLRAAALSAFTMHNETLNVWSGALSFLLAAWLWWSAGVPALRGGAPAALLRRFAAWLAVQASCVVSYHALLSYPPTYDVMSAVDLAGVSLLTQGLLCASHIPGMSAVHARLPPNTRDAVLAAEAGALLLASAAVVALRLRIRRESPPALLAANCLAYVPIVVDFARGAWPHAAAVVAPALLVGGVAAYALRLPERVARSPACDLFNSHTVWHLCYTASVAVYAAHAVRCALRAAESATTGPG